MADEHQIAGVILGTAVGDAIGLPFEGISRRRVLKLLRNRPLKHRLVFGRGMISDDTEHTCMVAQALLASGGDPDRFARSLAWRLRGWLLALPAAVGLGTARATLKLWLGFPPSRSGVRSAGNGPAMRAALVGLYADQNHDLLCALVRSSTRLTHTDPRAEQGARVVAVAASVGARCGASGLDFAEVVAALIAEVADTQLRANLEAIAPHLARDAGADQFADALGLQRGVTGFVNHTVPVAIYCWLRHRHDFRTAVESAITLGGDTDTVGAIVGALAGATLGPEAIPQEWSANLCDWPRSVAWMRKLARRLSDNLQHQGARGPAPLFWPGVLPRNVLFLLIVLAHGFRRLIPL